MPRSRGSSSISSVSMPTSEFSFEEILIRKTDIEAISQADEPSSDDDSVEIGSVEKLLESLKITLLREDDEPEYVDSFVMATDTSFANDLSVENISQIDKASIGSLRTLIQVLYNDIQKSRNREKELEENLKGTTTVIEKLQIGKTKLAEKCVDLGHQVFQLERLVAHFSNTRAVMKGYRNLMIGQYDNARIIKALQDRVQEWTVEVYQFREASEATIRYLEQRCRNLSVYGDEMKKRLDQALLYAFRTPLEQRQGAHYLEEKPRFIKDSAGSLL
ncbi:hypothetical protein NEOLI_002453 [Neolecta irregularis DAH-3]|uniref:Uncharacterized protein n=1 Tax=Neolecta irregularis (strain DAH-3) TaxID=1198029 RepID=A0A1U7LVH2_NEOID|nr:hypothetical protein NEOLI_002453 [Neolecta irregularis DAH-3]|eukprot:OLL26657.1 hypothetical protein NEOLI_002453 [Neolecta irregularis DAH-3]